VSVADAWFEASMFLVDEGEALDAGRYRDWLEMLAPDIRYRMPVRVTRARTLVDSVLADMDHFDEDRYSLEKRVQRLETEFAWTEDPPSRTRRFVTNVRLLSAGEDAGATLVRSSLLLFRSRGDVRPPEWVSAQRHDVLRRNGAELRLASRTILVDEAVLRTQNLAVFL
jgi:phthalate 3,4-dioxygenase beta subunit